mgnify:CR=1 FL=1
MKCKHENCDSSKALWLNINLEKNPVISVEGKIKRHRYCKHCGTIEYKREERAKGTGYFANILTRIKNFLEKEHRTFGIGNIKITDAQVRLIMKEIEEIEDFEDRYWRSFDSQKEVFIKIVRKYVPRLSAHFINAFFDNAPLKEQSKEELILHLYGIYEDEEKEAKRDIYTDEELYE